MAKLELFLIRSENMRVGKCISNLIPKPGHLIYGYLSFVKRTKQKQKTTTKKKRKKKKKKNNNKKKEKQKTNKDNEQKQGKGLRGTYLNNTYNINIRM